MREETAILIFFAAVCCGVKKNSDLNRIRQKKNKNTNDRRRLEVDW